MSRPRIVDAECGSAFDGSVKLRTEEAVEIALCEPRRGIRMLGHLPIQAHTPSDDRFCPRIHYLQSGFQSITVQSDDVLNQVIMTFDALVQRSGGNPDVDGESPSG
ncbi:hypothetical protein [Mycolicibacterium austroafricanum]|uniref:hypothetical protein n=1 Tax=Mycolicibacterium austroafricanum TaxID=39687 RepID=UPI0011AE727B|nr:hypothetical protein [Mycolicibacterium austroafricanum]QZY47033.1 hypothetical protein K5L12_04570 [Mycolicibacterium austroafricanum]